MLEHQENTTILTMQLSKSMRTITQAFFDFLNADFVPEPFFAQLFVASDWLTQTLNTVEMGIVSPDIARRELLLFHTFHNIISDFVQLLEQGQFDDLATTYGIPNHLHKAKEILEEVIENLELYAIANPDATDEALKPENFLRPV